jgi:hypothetical protein
MKSTPFITIIIIIQITTVLTLFATTNAYIGDKRIKGTFIVLDGNENKLLDLSHTLGMNTIVLEGVGNMWAHEQGTTCANANYTFTASNQKALVRLIQRAHSLNMTVFVGLLTISAGAAYEWSNCYKTYVQFQIEVAKQIVQLLSFLGSNAYHWYIPQEAELDALPLSNPNCSHDGETRFYRELSNALYTLTPSCRILISPYYLPNKSPQDLASRHSTMLACCPRISISSPQDGCGSFDIPTDLTRLYFEQMASNMPQGYGQVLWANVETFLPKAKICQKASDERIQRQIASVQHSVAKIINFWSYNLPGAPTCPYK